MDTKLINDYYSGDEEYSDYEESGEQQDDFPFDRTELEKNKDKWEIYFTLPDGTPLPVKYKLVEAIEDLFILENVDTGAQSAVSMTDSGEVEDGGKANMILKK